MAAIPTRGIRFAALVFMLTLAGCLQPQDAPATVTPASVMVGDRPDTAFGEVTTGPAAGPDLNATLAAAPKLVAGEWWRLRFASPLAGTDQSDVIRVVAAVEPEGYVIGMPHEGWAKELISYHSPALGDVGLDLSYPVHNEVFQPIKFPLEQDATWETSFATAKYTGKVESIDGSKATITLKPVQDPQPTDPVFALFGFTASPITLVYDATVHEVVKYESGIGSYEVVEHGYDFQGWVTIPRAEHTAIDYGQLGPTPGRTPGPRTIDITGGYNRMTLLQGIFPLEPGVYKIRAVAPNGNEIVVETTNTAIFRFTEVRDPDGTWTSEDTVVGAGVTFTMGIAYHQFDIRLPDGVRRMDHSHAVLR